MADGEKSGTDLLFAGSSNRKRTGVVMANAVVNVGLAAELYVKPGFRPSPE